MRSFRMYGVILALLMLPGLVWAQNVTSSAQEDVSLLVKQIKELQQQDHDLQERIRILEDNQKGIPPPGSAPAVPATDSSVSPVQEQTTSVPLELHDLRGFQWRGFGELDYKVLNQRRPETGSYGFVPGSAGDFYTGRF